jgi:hypothetical protein
MDTEANNLSREALSKFIDGVEEAARDDRLATREYLRALARRGQAFLSRLRGEPTAMPPPPNRPESLPRLTRPIEEVRQSLADRAARLGTEEDEKRE